MSRKLQNTIGIAVVSLCTALAVWDFTSVQQINEKDLTPAKPTDYSTLEKVVDIWAKEKRVFEYNGSPVSSESAEEDVRSEVLISVRNGSGESGLANTIADELGKINGVKVDDISNASANSETSIAYKKSADENVVAEVKAFLEDRYANILENSLSENAEYDMIVTLGALN